MRNIVFLTGILAAGIAPALAQQTLDYQTNHVQNGQPAVADTVNHPPTPNEWPANPAMATRPAPTIGSQGSGAIPALPLEVQTSGDVTYINGGISDEEKAELQTKENEFNMHLLLTSPKGDFISDVSLRLLDNQGTPFLTVANAGPYFYAHLRPGSYTLEATSSSGEVKKLKFTISDTSNMKEHLAFAEPGGITTQHAPTAKIE